MKIEVVTTLGAAPARLVELMLAPEQLARLVARLDMVDQIEELSREERGGKIERTLRYRAATAGKIPAFLSRYKDRAPEHVFWEQREVWDVAGGRMTYTIVPQVPAHWGKYYTNSGSLAVSAHARGATLTARLELEVKVFGFQTLIERALEPEIKRLLELQSGAVEDGLKAQG